MKTAMNVLAVLDDIPNIVEAAANDLLTMSSTPSGRPHDPDPSIAAGLEKVREARAAVAELIAAANTVERQATRHPGDDRMFDRLFAALAHVGSGVIVPAVAQADDGTTSMYWAGHSAYQFGLTLKANPWDSENPAEAREHWSWRKGFASAERDALARIGSAK